VAISTIDGLLAAFPGQMATFVKSAPTMQAGGQWYSPWLVAGIPGLGTAPSSGAAGNTVDASLAGGIPFTNPGSGLTYLVKAGFTASGAGVMHLYDRLWHNSGLSPTVLTAQTVNSVTLPSRCPVLGDTTGETFDTLGNQVEAWLQVYGTAMGAGTLSATISYTDEAGNSGSTGTQLSFASAAMVGRAFPFSLAAGDRGVRSIQSYQQTATNTSGVFGLVLRRRIASFAISAVAQYGVQSFDQLGMPVIPNSAHLEVLYVPSTTTTTPTLHGDIQLVQG